MTLELDRLRPSVNSLHLPLRVDIGRPGPDVTLLQLDGDVDRETQQLLAAALDDVLDEWPRLVIIGLEHLRFLASCGLGSLVRAHRKATNQGIDLVLAAPSLMISHALSVSGVDRTIPVCRSVGQALTRY